MSLKGKGQDLTASTLMVPSSMFHKKESSNDAHDEVKWKFKTDIFASERDLPRRSREERRQTLLTSELQRMLNDTDLKFFKNTGTVNLKLPGINDPAGSDSDDTSLQEFTPNDQQLSAFPLDFPPGDLSHVESQDSTVHVSSTSLYLPKIQSSTRLEDELHLHHLVELMKVFHRAGERGSDGLDISEFRVALGEILGEKMDSRISTMFMKIDIESGGKVDWDKFCNYMVMEYQERQLMTEGMVQVLYPHDVKVLQSLARDMFTRITFLPVVNRRVLTEGNKQYITQAIEEGGSNKVEGRFVTISKEGNFCFWNTNFTLNKATSLDVGRLPWVTDMVVLPNASKILVSLANNMLALFDLANNFDRMTTVVNIPFTIITMDYWYDSSDPNKAVLVTGDMAGGVSRLKFDKALVHLFGPQIGNQCYVTFRDISDRKVEGVKSTYFSKVLKGHLTAVMHIVVNSHHGHIFSFSKDLELRVWNIGDHMCIQTFSRFQSLLPSLPTAFYVQPYTEVIMIGTHHLGVLEPATDTPTYLCDRVFSHNRALCAALYNHNFNQVVSGCHGSVVCVWDIYTGEKIIQFSRCHGDKEITAMAFDSTGRQLFTGGRDGSIKVWNFNNGACILILKNNYGAEITSICCFKKKIIAGGWSRVLNYYTNSRHASDDDYMEDTIPDYFGENVHKEDILCMSHMEPNMLASASYDGDIVLWNLDGNRLTCRLNASEYRNRISSHYKNRYGDNRMYRRLDSSTRHPVIKDKSVEKLAFLYGREQDLSSASLVACGSGGWIHFWNIYGGGLIGEFNIWNNTRHTIREDERMLHSVTALKIDSSITTLFTGSSLGYIQLCRSHFSVYPGGFNNMSSCQVVVDHKQRPGGILDSFHIMGVLDSSKPAMQRAMRESQQLPYLKKVVPDPLAKDSVLPCHVTKSSKEAVADPIKGAVNNSNKIWKIEDYCYKLPGGTRKPIITPPPLRATWRGHDRAIVCLDLAEDKDLIISASTDHCVRLWSNDGRYIGTFGERKPWNLTFPLDDVNLPHRIPYGLNRCASIQTIQTVSGPTASKWKHAKRLYKMLQESKVKEKEKGIAESYEKYAEIEPVEGDGKEDVPILGHCYERKTRFRLPIVPLKLTKHGDGKTVNIYNKMQYWDLEDVHMPKSLPKQYHTVHLPTIESLNITKPSLLSTPSTPLPTYQLRKPFTEATLLPRIRFECPLNNALTGQSFSSKKLRRRVTICNPKRPSIRLYGANTYKKYFEMFRDRSEEDGVRLTSATSRPFSMGTSRVELLNSRLGRLQRKVKNEMENIGKVTGTIMKDHKVELDPKRLT